MLYRNTEERLHVKAGDVGQLEGLLVQLQGALACWQLAWIRVTHVASGQATLFPCNAWLDSGGLSGSLAEQAEVFLTPGRCGLLGMAAGSSNIGVRCVGDALGVDMFARDGILTS